MMRIGILSPIDTMASVSLSTRAKMVVRAERDRFDSYWFVEHPFSGPDVMTSIALAGQETRFIELGTASMSIYPRHPLVLMQQLVTVQSATLDRFSLGLSSSHQQIVEQQMGLAYGEPGPYLREYLALLKQLYQGEQVDFQGKYLKIRMEQPLVPRQMPPVLIAGNSPEMLDAAGSLADGSLVYLAGPQAMANYIVPRLNQAAAAAGRHRVRLCAGLPIAVTDDPEGIKAQLNQTLSGTLSLPIYQQMMAMEGASSPGELGIIGSEAVVRDGLRQMEAAGVTDFLAMIVTEPGEAQIKSRTWRLLADLLGRV